jgi:uncharacterized integral membrane protein
MQFLRTLFWVIVAVIAVIFAVRNWIPVTVNLWGGIVADVKLPVLLAIAFLIGFLPAFALYRATRWRLRRRLENAERALVDARPAEAPQPAGMLPPGAAPIAVPPAV